MLPRLRIWFLAFAALLAVLVASSHGEARFKFGWGGGKAIGVSSLTVDEFPPGYGTHVPQFTNLTISGTSVTDAGGGGKFKAVLIGESLQVGGDGVNHRITAIGGINSATLETAPANQGTGKSGFVFTSGNIISRAAGATGTQGRTVHFTGTYTGPDPTDAFDLQLTYRLGSARVTGGSVMQAWSQCTGFSASAGVWGCDMAVSLNVEFVHGQARDHVVPTTVSNLQKMYWGVGILGAIEGQSNQAKTFGNGPAIMATDTGVDPRSRIHAKSGFRKLFIGSPGVAWDTFNGNDRLIQLTKEMVSNCDCLIGILYNVVTASSVKQWLTAANGGYADNDSNNVWYTSGVGGGGYVGNNGDGLSGTSPSSPTVTGLNSPYIYAKDFEFWAWQQGENEAFGGGSTTYAGFLSALHQQLADLNGRTKAQLVACIFPIGVEPQVNNTLPVFTATNTAADTVRQAHLNYIATTTNALYCGGLQYFNHNIAEGGDQLHAADSLSTSDDENQSVYLTQAFLKAIGTSSRGAEGPKIVSAQMQVGSSILRATVAHSLSATSLVDTSGSTSGTGLQGFQIKRNGTISVATSNQITGATEISFNMPFTRVGGDTVTIEHQTGANPNDIISTSWTNLVTSGAGATTVTSASSLFSANMVGVNLVVTAGTNWVAGSYQITTYNSATSIVVASSPTPAGAGSGGTATVKKNFPAPQVVWDNYNWSGVTYPPPNFATHGYPLQATNGPLTVSP